MDGSAFDLDQRVRVEPFNFVAEQTQRTSDGVLPRTILTTGFSFDGTRVPLIGPQGIFKPTVLPGMPLSITTIPSWRGATLSERMGQNAFVTWVVHPTPWELEEELIARLSLPLNLDKNDGHPIHAVLSHLRREARARARELPIESRGRQDCGAACKTVEAEKGVWRNGS